MSTLEVATLQQRVSRLEALIGNAVSESSSPNYLTIDPVTGLVSAAFSGVVNALGLTLPSSTVIGGNPQNEIQWQDTSGVTNASIVGAEAPTSNLISTALNSLHVFAKTWMQAGAAPFIELSARASATQVAELDLNASTSAQSVSATAGLNTATVIDSTGASSFPQLTSSQALHMAIGMTSISFSASTDSATTTVTHGLPVTPTVVLATINNAPAFGEIPILNTATYGSTTFLVNGQTTTSWSGSVNVAWLAIG